MDKALLIIMTKWHGFGRCKTRLSKDIGKSNSANVQSVMTNHTISVAKFLQENKLFLLNLYDGLLSNFKFVVILWFPNGQLVNSN